MSYRELPEAGKGTTLEARARTVGRSLDFRLTVDFVLAGSAHSDMLYAVQQSERVEEPTSRALTSAAVNSTGAHRRA